MAFSDLPRLETHVPALSMLHTPLNKVVSQSMTHQQKPYTDSAEAPVPMRMLSKNMSIVAL